MFQKVSSVIIYWTTHDYIENLRRINETFCWFQPGNNNFYAYDNLKSENQNVYDSGAGGMFLKENPKGLKKKHE